MAVVALETILKHPSGCFLVNLWILCNTDPQQSVVDVVALHAPATLRVLELRLSRPIDLSSLWRALPRLRTFVLDLRSGYSTTEGWLVPEITLGAVDLPALRHLRISDHRRGLTTLLTVAFPLLEELDMNLTELAVLDLRPFLARTDLPALRALRMWETTSTNDFCRELAISPLGRQLTRVDVANGQLTDAGAESWAAAQSSPLEAVFVGGNPLSRRGRETLQRVAKSVVEGDDER